MLAVHSHNLTNLGPAKDRTVDLKPFSALQAAGYEEQMEEAVSEPQQAKRAEATRYCSAEARSQPLPGVCSNEHCCSRGPAAFAGSIGP